MRTLKLFPLVFLLSAASHLNEPIKTENEKASLFDLQGDYCQLVDFPFIDARNAPTIQKKKIFVYSDKKSETANRKPQKRTISNTSNNTEKRQVDDHTTSEPVLQLETEKTKSHYKSCVSLDKIDWNLYEAIQDYKGPSFEITSAFRSHGVRGSKHPKGKALDVHWSETVALYFISEQGQEWLKKHQLQFFIEDNYKSFIQKIAERLRPNCRYIGHASNLHIHLEKIN